MDTLSQPVALIAIGVIVVIGIALVMTLLMTLLRRRSGVSRSSSDWTAGPADQIDPPDSANDTESSYAPTKPLEEPPQELIDLIGSGDCMLFAGGGLAAQAGVPTWREFLSQLVLFSADQGFIDADLTRNLLESLEGGFHDAVANELFLTLPEELVKEQIVSAFNRGRPSRAHRILGGLPFAGAFTTSFDSLWMRAFSARDPKPLVPWDTSEFLEAIRNRSFFVLSLYGSVDRTDALPSSARFNPPERNLDFAELLTSVFDRYSFFFVGAGTDGIKNFFDSFSLSVGEKSALPRTRHFALVGQPGGVDEVEIRYLRRRYNVKVIDFLPDERYSEIPEFCQKLRSKVRGVDESAKPSDVPLVNRVVLNNIGPFDDLQMELAPTWNVLLGDNGMGKSIFLRSVAAVLCGEFSDEEALKRLLRTGSRSGSIAVKVGPTEYRTQLERDPDGRVRVRHQTRSPLPIDKWLALGFPALRAMTWKRPRGPRPESSISSVDSSIPAPETDLLPILVGDPDTRLSDLKQWITNLDWIATKERGRRGEDARKLIESFFDVLDELTPDMSVRLDEINTSASNVDIQLRLDGDVVPLEAVSQGTASMMCWVGTLLQRLHEVHLSLEDPTQGGALLLIDEIGAHMHPAWQRLLVKQFREVFPKVQVIANTHSPLVVGSLAPEELILVRRAPLFSQTEGIARVKPLTTERSFGTEALQELVIETERGQAERHVVPIDAHLLVADGETIAIGDQLTRADMKTVAEKPTIDVRGWRADQILTAPLFDLDSARDPLTEEQIAQYTDLIAKDSLTQKDQSDLEELAQALDLDLPSKEETAEAQKAFELIEAAVSHEIAKLTPEEREKVTKELKAQLSESATGSRRRK